MNFEQFTFNPNLNAAIKAAGYSHPTPIQKQAIPLVLQGRDVLGLAQTGTGKTAAFMLPILQHLEKKPSRQPRVLIIEPTRELAEQVHQSIGNLWKEQGTQCSDIRRHEQKLPDQEGASGNRHFGWLPWPPPGFDCGRGDGYFVHWKSPNTGEALTFASEADASTVWQIEKILGARIERRCLAGFTPAERRTPVLPNLAAAQSRGRRFRLGTAGRKRRTR